MVAIARNIGCKRAAELAYTGDTITAAQALDWGLVNRVVPAAAVEDLLGRATRGSRASKALGKRTLNRQLPLSQADAYRLATEVMAESSQSVAAREGMAPFLAKRRPEWNDQRAGLRSHAGDRVTCRYRPPSHQTGSSREHRSTRGDVISW